MAIYTTRLRRTNPGSGRVKDLNQGRLDLKFSALNHSATPPNFVLANLDCCTVMGGHETNTRKTKSNKCCY